MIKRAPGTGMKFNYEMMAAPDKKMIRFGTMQPSDRTPSPRGVILLLNGRSEFMEKYEKVASWLADSGYIIKSMDWRGQGLSVRELPDRDKGYIKDFDIYLDDLKQFYRMHVAPLSLPVTIIAHSMGGHNSLRFLATDEFQSLMSIDKAILLSPMVDIITSHFKNRTLYGFLDRGARITASVAELMGLGKSYIPGGGDYCRQCVEFKDNVLTHDWNNFWLEHEEIGRNRDLALGGVTWGWLKAAFRSISILKRESCLRKIKTPIFIFSAGEDQVVSNSAQKRVCSLLKKCSLISIPGARHEILFETPAIQKVIWNHIFNLLDSSNSYKTDHK